MKKVPSVIMHHTFSNGSELGTSVHADGFRVEYYNAKNGQFRTLSSGHKTQQLCRQSFWDIRDHIWSN